MSILFPEAPSFSAWPQAHQKLSPSPPTFHLIDEEGKGRGTSFSKLREGSSRNRWLKGDAAKGSWEEAADGAIQETCCKLYFMAEWLASASSTS